MKGSKLQAHGDDVLGEGHTFRLLADLLASGGEAECCANSTVLRKSEIAEARVKHQAARVCQRQSVNLIAQFTWNAGQVRLA